MLNQLEDPRKVFKQSVVDNIQQKAYEGDQDALKYMYAYWEMCQEFDEQNKRSYNQFSPQDYQKEFFECTKTRILVHSANGTGKSRCAYRKAAGLALGYDSHGGVVPNPSVGVIVCPTWNQIANLAYRQLFERGAFDICGDCGFDRDRCEKNAKCGGDSYEEWSIRATEAPPFIPHDFVIPEEENFLNKKHKWPINIAVRTVTGEKSIIHFRPGDSDPQKSEGFEWHWALVDEMISEQVRQAIIRGLRKNNGPYIHVGTPLESGECMLDMYDAWRKGSKVHACFQWKMEQNKYISPEYIEQQKRELPPEMWKVRGEGQFLRLQGLVYGEFDEQKHICPAKFKDGTTFDAWKEWTRYIVIDPGWQHECGILEFAVSPEGAVVPGRDGETRKTKKDDWFLVWEFKQSGLQIDALFKMIQERKKIGPVYRIIIDPASEQTTQGSPISVRSALARPPYRLSTFLPPMKREQRTNRHLVFGKVKPALKIRHSDGYTKLSILEYCRGWVDEVRRYRWADDSKNQYSYDVVKKKDEFMDCTKYFAACDPKYVDPTIYAKTHEEEVSPFGKEYEEAMERARKELERAKR